jgi:hypothetical protein
MIHSVIIATYCDCHYNTGLRRPIHETPLEQSAQGGTQIYGSQGSPGPLKLQHKEQDAQGQPKFSEKLCE